MIQFKLAEIARGDVSFYGHSSRTTQGHRGREETPGITGVVEVERFSATRKVVKTSPQVAPDFIAFLFYYVWSEALLLLLSLASTKKCDQLVGLTTKEETEETLHGTWPNMLACVAVCVSVCNRP